MAHSSNFICRKFSLAIVFLLLLQPAIAQYNFNKVDAWLTDNLKSIGGRAVLVIYKDGKVVYNNDANKLSATQKFIGKRIAKKKGKDPDVILQDFNSSTQQLIASCSKWLSATLVMTFVDEGKLNLDDSVGKFLPIMSLNGKGNITIRQCLSHLTGVKADKMKDETAAITKASSMDEAIEHIAQLPMEGEPGTTFHYSSVGLQIAAAVIEKISGQHFETLFQERIAKPCNMLHTSFGSNEVPLAAGGARSTADDYINFLRMILHDGMYNGKMVLSKKSVIAMQINQISKNVKIKYSPAEAGNWGYGFGEWVMAGEDGMRSNAVTSPGLFGSFPWVDNEKQYAGFLMTFNLKNKGRNEKYMELKKLVDEALE